MPARFLSFCCGVSALAVSAGAQTAAPDVLAVAVETAIEAGQAREAARAFDALVDARAPGKPALKPDPELNGLYGRMHGAFGTVRVARAYLERADGPTVPPARKAATALALSETQRLLGDYRAAALTLSSVDAAALSGGDRMRLPVLRARAALPTDPAQALVLLAAATGWEAEWVRGQAHLLRGDVPAARAAAERAWTLAADAPLRSGAVSRAALLRAGLAMAEGRRDQQIAMLLVAGAARKAVDQRFLYSPLCGQAGVRPDDHLTIAVHADRHGRADLFPVGASRPAVVAAFMDALRAGALTQSDRGTSGGTMFTLRCRSFGVGGAPYDLGPDPWAARLADTGLFLSMDRSPEDDRLNALAERYDAWKARLGENNPALLPVAVDLSLGLSDRAVQGDVEPARVLDAQEKVRALAAALGGADGFIPTDADIQTLRGIATSTNPESRARGARDHALAMIGRVPPEVAFAFVQGWFNAEEKPAPADRLAIADRLLDRLPKSASDKRVRSTLLRKGEAQRELGDYAAARRTFAAVGAPAGNCVLGDTEPRTEKVGVTHEDYPDDLLGVGFAGANMFELDVDAKGRVLGRRMIFSELGGLFDAAAQAALPRFSFAPALRDGRGMACAGHVLKISWRVGEEEREAFPDLTVSPDMSSS